MEVLGVHGIAQEQRGRPELVEAWAIGLANGVEMAAGRDRPLPGLDLAFYGDLFLSDVDQGALEAPGKGTAVPRGLSLLDWIQLPVADEDEEFLSVATAYVEQTFPDLGPAMGAPRVPAALQPLARRLTRRLDGRVTLQLIAALRQVKRYLDDDVLAATIRERVIDGLTEGPTVVVAHSLGTVVTLETLTLHPHLRIPTLITVGSPLGMHAVTSRLRLPDGTRGLPSAPSNAGHWRNIYDPGDPVAAAGGLSRLWPSVIDYTVGNGGDPHNITHYLSKRVSGETVLEAIG